MQTIKKKNLKIKKGLVSCSHCKRPASWNGSIEFRRPVCLPCITGDKKYFDPSNLIPERYVKTFIKKFNNK